MTSEPLVSVLMTSFNREQYIAEAIQSVLGSSYNNFELIVVDDQSKDHTVTIAKQFADEDLRVKVYVNEVNLGDYPNRNKAASYASGEFLMYVDSDDTIFLDGIERCVNALLKFPGSQFAMYSPEKAREAFEIKSADALRKHLLTEPFLQIGPGGTILKRSFFKAVNGYPENYGPANDMYFNLKACSYSDIVMLPFEFLHYRRHEGQEINNQYGYLLNSYSYMRDALNELSLPVSNKELKWLHKKNNRRFVVNILKYFARTLDIKKTNNVIKRSRFTFKDAITGIFH